MVRETASLELATDCCVLPRANPATDPRFPGAVRSAILAQHRVIEGILLRVDEVLRQIELGEPIASFATPRLTKLVSELSSELRAHLAYENHHWLPGLRGRAGWDEERVHRVEEEHTEQRDRLDELMLQICRLSTPDVWVFRAVRDFVDHLRIDMREEEQGILTEGALREEGPG